MPVIFISNNAWDELGRQYELTHDTVRKKMDESFDKFVQKMALKGLAQIK